MAEILFNFLECSLSKHTSTAPQEHEAKLAGHLQATDGADVGSIAFAYITLGVVSCSVRWVLHQIQVFDVLLTLNKIN